MSTDSIPGRASAVQALRQARIARGLTQAELADAVGSAQSGISRLEAGNLNALSDDKIRQIADVLGVAIDLTVPTKEIQLLDASSGPLFRHCASPWCPSCIPYRVRGFLRLWPVLFPAAPDSPAGTCAFCGEPMKTRCARCSQPIQSPGAFCTHCGTDRVRLDDETAADLAHQRRICTGEGDELLAAAAAIHRLAARHAQAATPPPADPLAPRGAP